jgi:hypothetical protein
MKGKIKLKTRSITLLYRKKVGFRLGMCQIANYSLTSRINFIWLSLEALILKHGLEPNISLLKTVVMRECMNPPETGVFAS